MRPLHETLLIAANAIERGTVNYDYKYPGCCQCGVVFQAITGRSQIQLHNDNARLTQACPDVADQRWAQWQWLARAFCPVTGIPQDELLRGLHDAGMTAENITHLENLSDPEVLARCKFWKRGKYFEKQKNVVEYLRAWAALLIEKQDKAAEQWESRPLKPAVKQPA